jgi:hypothetical protein
MRPWASVTGAAGVVVGFAIVSNRIGALAFQGMLDKVERRREIALAYSVWRWRRCSAGHRRDGHYQRVDLGRTGCWCSVSRLIATISVSYIVQYFREGEHERVLSYENVAANAGPGSRRSWRR